MTAESFKAPILFNGKVALSALFFLLQINSAVFIFNLQSEINGHSAAYVLIHFFNIYIAES